MYRVTYILFLSLLIPLHSLAQIFTLHPPNTTKLVSTDIQIDCTALTSDLTIRWMKDGSILSPTSSAYEITLNITEDGLTSIFHIYSGVFPNTGVYTCLAYRGNILQEQSHPGTLMVHGPVLYLEYPLDQVVYLNQPVVLTCHVQGGPLPTLQWTRDVTGVNINVVTGGTLSISTVIDNSYEIVSRLTFTHAQSSHNGTYHCETENNYGADDRIARISVNNEAIQPVSISQPTDGTTYTLIVSSSNSISQACTASGLPVPSLQWIIPASAKNALVQTNPTPTLFIANPAIEDAGTYTCIANNTLTSDAASIHVNIVEVPVVSASSDTTVMSGRSITLSCTATGTPTPTVTLAHPNSSLLPLDQNGRVILYETSYRDTGVYTCLATVLSISEQATFMLTVLSAPAITTLPSDTSVGVGQDATFRCIVAGTPTPTITWTFNTHTVLSAPIPSTLIVPNVHSSDLGVYTCMASNVYGSINASAVLSLVSIPQFLVTPTSTVASIGESVQFFCTATPDTVTIEWYVDGTKIPNTGVKYFVLTDGSLVVSNLAFSDSNSYTCRVSNPAGLLEASAILTVIERPIFTQEPLDQTVSEGESVTFSCEVSGDPLPSLSWIDGDGNTIETSSRLTILMPTPNSITLTIPVVALSDAGEYTCLAENGLDAMSLARLAIIRPPQVSIEPSTQNAILGLQFILTCVVTYSVPPPSFQWFKDSVRITTDSRVKSFTNGSLIISPVQSTDSGVYMCVAVNDVGSDSGIVNVGIIIRPTFTPTPTSHVVRLGGEITMPCNAEGVPLPVTSWLLPDNTIVPNNGRFSWVSQVNGPLTIRQVEATDQGVYTCMATNEAGRVSMSIQLTVQIHPSPPTNAEVVVVSESRVRVSWVVPFNGYSEITGYQIQQKITEDFEDAILIWEQSGRTEGEQDSALVINLIPFERYQFRVAAVNTIGVGAFSMQTNKTQLPPSSPPSPENLTTRALNSTAIHLAWSAPTYPYGVLHSYDVAWGVQGNETLRIVSTPESQGPQYTFIGLSIYTQYMFSVRAVNTNPSGGVFNGNYSDPVYQRTGEEPPIGPPLNLNLATVFGGILIEWNAPSLELRRGVITGYNIFYRESLMNLLFPTLPPLMLNQTNRTNESLLAYRDELTEYYRFGNMTFQVFLLPIQSERNPHSLILGSGYIKPDVYYDIKLQAMNSAGIGPNSTAQTAKSGQFSMDLVNIIVPSVVVPTVLLLCILVPVIAIILYKYFTNWRETASNRKTYRESGSAGSRRPLVAPSTSLQASNFDDNQGFDDLIRNPDSSTARRHSPSGKDESYMAAINEINRQIMESVGESDQEATDSGSESSGDESGSGSLSGINTDVFRVETNKHAESALDTAGDTSIYNYDSVMPRVGEERTGSFATTKQTDFDDDLGDTIREAPVLYSQDYSDDDEDRLSVHESPGDLYPQDSDLSDDERLTYTDYMKSIQGGEQPKPKSESQVSMGEYSHISDMSRQAKRQQAQIRLDEKQVKEEKKRLEQDKKMREKIATRERKAREKRAKVERKGREKEAKQRLKERQHSFSPKVLDPDVKYKGMAMRGSDKNKDVLF